MQELNTTDRQLQRKASEPPMVRESSRTVLAIAVALAVAVAIGAYFLGFAENDVSVTSKASSVTTGQSSSPPATALKKTDRL